MHSKVNNINCLLWESKHEKLNTEISKLVPEINLIKDMRLRKLVMQIWSEIFSKSEFKTMQEIPNFPSRDYPSKGQSFPQMTRISLIEHTRAVTINAINVAKMIKELHGIEADIDYLIAACLLHDVDKMVKVTKRVSEILRKDPLEFKEGSSALWAQVYCRRMGLDDDLVAVIAPEKDIPVDKLENVILIHSDLTDADALRWKGGIRDLFITKIQ